ncbi:MAG: hypothetical protein FWF56_06615 [Firmicutes bacterium]|nr:hypothetical protein [Bacillota bacterium]
MTKQRKLFSRGRVVCIALVMTVMMSITMMLTVVLRSEYSIVQGVGEYWQTHSNTRVSESTIDSIFDEIIGNDIQKSAILNDEQVQWVFQALAEEVLMIDQELYKYVNEDNIREFIEYEFDGAMRDETTAEIVQNSFSRDYSNTTQSRVDSSGLYALLVGAGLAVTAAYVFTGAYTTVGVAAAGMWVFPPITFPAAAATIAAALLVLTVVIIANWDVISPIIGKIVDAFVSLVDCLAGIVRDFFNGVINSAQKEKETEFGGYRYIKVVLDMAKITEIASNQQKRNSVYIILGIEGNDVKLGQLVGSATGGISDTVAIEIMRMNPGKFHLGKIVVSIYTYDKTKAYDITKSAGNGFEPKFDLPHTKPGFEHYHHGYNYANTSEDIKLPHAFYGNLV